VTRVTKKELQRRLDEAIAFQRYLVAFLHADSGPIYREFPGFISVEKYPPWCVPGEEEFGMLGGIRFFYSRTQEFKSLEDFINKCSQS